MCMTIHKGHIMFTTTQALEAIKQHNTIFFNHKLEPVEPKDGQWFCEFKDYDGEVVIDGPLVKYLGQDEVCLYGDGKAISRIAHAVASDGSEYDREPEGLILILQA